MYPTIIQKEGSLVYQTNLKNPGRTRMEAILRQNLVWPKLRKDVEAEIKNCHECQIGKKVRKKYSVLPDNLTEIPVAWNRVDVDLIEPLTINTPSGNKE
jgi:hypothetical protein